MSEIDTDKISSLRKKLGLTLQEAARAAGFTSRQAWHHIESGRRDNLELATLNRVAKVLGTSAKDLLK